METNDDIIQDATSGEYKYGFVSDIDTDILPPGLTEDTIRFISARKGEPEWLLDFRLKAFRYWQTLKVPRWAHLDIPEIDFQAISYYAEPKKKEGPKSLDEVDPQLIDTFNRLGIPLEEQKQLSGMAVDAVMDSVSVKTTHREKLAQLGIIFCSISEAVKDYPDLVKKYLGSVVSYRDNFWTPDRLEKASKLGLTPVEVAILASIVEEESNKTDEHPKIARLYLNRLKRGMRLQADPTVKFATGDFSLRRIRGRHLSLKSPYNTYLNAGLPPGPIRVADGRAIDAVLSAPEAPYLYMCAKPDFSGYHDFASDYQTHRANARRYQKALNERSIK